MRRRVEPRTRLYETSLVHRSVGDGSARRSQADARCESGNDYRARI